MEDIGRLIEWYDLISTGKQISQKTFNDIKDNKLSKTIISIIEHNQRGNYNTSVELISDAKINLISQKNQVHLLFIEILEAQAKWRLGAMLEFEILLFSIRPLISKYSNQFLWFKLEFLRLQSILHIFSGDLIEAEYLIKEHCLDQSKEASSKTHYGKFLNNLGYIYRIQGRPHDAIFYLKKAIENLETENIQTDLANSTENLAVIFYSLKRTAMADEYLQKALKIREQVGDQFYLSWTLYNIAYIRLQENTGEVDLE